MENEKKITAPKRKKPASTVQKKNAVKDAKVESAGKKASSEDFKADSVGAFKPPRKVKTSEKTVKKSVRTPKADADETGKTATSESKPRRRKTAVKDIEKPAAQIKTTAKKISPKTTEKRSTKIETAAPEEDVSIIEIIRSIEVVPQTEIAIKMHNAVQSEPENPPHAETETKKTTAAEDSPVFKELAAPKLPILSPENRARLQMQSPTRIYFYWTLKNNPYQTLGKLFGAQQNQYQLVIKLFNLTRGAQEIHAVEAEGNWWFDVDADSAYRAELGFFAMNRPFIRILSSNTLVTPRQNPSPHRALLSEFSVHAKKFARLLDVSGYRQDAVEVALAGDDFAAATRATQKSFSQLTDAENIAEQDGGEMRYALLALAAGYALEDLRPRVGPSLMRILLENAGKVSAEKAAAILEENFDATEEEFFEPENVGAPSVFGASAINFPRGLRRRLAPKNFAPLSSHSLVE
ncbi:MAG: DUF4912 domain-containing protein [Pyrinomonadaceae bacterium]